MAIYSYYYGASAGSGIGIRAISRQLESLPVRSDLKDLASLHALESSDHEGEMLSYLLRRDGYGILGLSYTESPKSSGYGRSAPCGLQYVLPENELNGYSPRLGGIINFINFQKPASASPAPLDAFPLSESGYCYHNSTAVLASLVEGLVEAALSPQKEVLLVALPRGRSSEYATARYTIAEAMNYLPGPLRQNIRFFTGLPVAEGVTDHLAGFDNAVKYGANVIFCAHEHYERLMNYRSFMGVDMEKPGGRPGAYAACVAQTLEPAPLIARILDCVGRAITYDGLNQAALRVQRGETVTVDSLRASLDRSEQRCRELEQQVSRQSQEMQRMQGTYSQPQPNPYVRPQGQPAAYAGAQGRQPIFAGNQPQPEFPPQPITQEYDEPGKERSIFKVILTGLFTILAMALVVALVWLAVVVSYGFDFFPPTSPTKVRQALREYKLNHPEEEIPAAETVDQAVNNPGAPEAQEEQETQTAPETQETPETTETPAETAPGTDRYDDGGAE